MKDSSSKIGQIQVSSQDPENRFFGGSSAPEVDGSWIRVVVNLFSSLVHRVYMAPRLKTVHNTKMRKPIFREFGFRLVIKLQGSEQVRFTVNVLLLP